MRQAYQPRTTDGECAEASLITYTSDTSQSILANRAKSTVLLVGDRLWRYRFQYRQLDKLHVARILSDTGYQHFPIYSRMFQIVPRSYDATTDLYQELPHMLYRHGSTTESKGQSSIWLHHDFPSFGFKSEGLHLDCWNGPTQRISLEPETVQEQLHESQYQSRTDFERVKRWAGNVDIFLSSTEAQMSAELSVVPEVRPPPRARARKERKVKALDVGPSPESASNQDKRNVTSANIAVGTRVGEPAHSQHEIVQLVPRSEGKGQNVSVKPSTPDHYGENLPTSTLIDPGSPRDLLTPFVPLPLLMSPQSMLKPTALRHSSMQPYDFGTQNPSTAAIGYEAASIASPSNVVAPSTVGVSESSGALPMNMAAINMQRLEELRAAAPFTEQKINGVASRKRHKAMNQKAMKPTQSTGTTRTKGKTQQQLPLDKTNEVFGVLPPSLHPPQSPLQTKDHGPMIKGDTNFTWSSLKEEQSLSGEVACLLSPVLNAARAFSGELIFEIQLGQVFLKRNLENVEEKNYSFEELSDNFRGRMSNLHVDPPATVFSPMLTSNGNDVDYLRTLTSKDGPMFMEACDDSQVIYEFHCQTSKHEAFILRVDAESQDCSMDSSTDTLVTVNLLHPGHVWDARAVVRATSAISSAGHIGAALLELFNSLYAPAGSKRPTIYFQVRNEDILIQKIHVRRRTRHQCLMEGFEDVILTITEIQDLRISNGLAKVLNNGESVVQYLAAGLSHAEMVDDSKLWYECSLHIKSVRDMLNDNLSQGLGCLAKWTGNDIVQSPSFDKLLDLTTIVINNIDGLGVYNRAPRLPSQLNRSVTSANGIGGTNARSWKPDPILPGASASQCGADEARGVFW